MKKLVLTIMTILIVLTLSTGVQAKEWEFKINEYNDVEDTKINNKLTNAKIEPTVEDGIIRLPKGNPGALSFLGEDSFDVIALTKNGIEKISPTGDSNVLAEIGILSNPLAIFHGGNYPDIIVVEDAKNNKDTNMSQVTHFSCLGGNNYTENSSIELSIKGLDKTVGVNSRQMDKATINEAGDFIYHFWMGDKYSEVDNGSIRVGGFSNPIALATFDDSYNAVVVDENGAKIITNLNSVTKTITGNFTGVGATSGGNFALIQGNEVIHYNIVDSEVHQNDYLTVKDGLEAPTAIALRPGSFDRAIVDGDRVKFYFWTGSALELVGEVPFDALEGAGKFITKARVISRVIKEEKSKEVTHIKISHGGIDTADKNGDINIEHRSDTWVEWYISGDSDIIRDDSLITTDDISNMGKWQKINTLNDWYSVNNESVGVTSFRLLAILKTKDRDYTPRIHDFIKVEYRIKLDKPELLLPAGGVYYTSNPEIWWDLRPADEDLKQNAFQVVLYNDVSGEEILNTGKILASQTSYVIRNTDNQSSLWGEGVNEFNIKVKVWDDVGNESPFSTHGSFKVIAFDKPVITKIVSPKMKGREWINRFTENTELPVAKAGSAITFQIHGIGVNELEKVEIRYPGERSLDKNNNWETVVGLEDWSTRKEVGYITGQEFAVVEGYEEATNKIWEASLFTDADIEVCPSGTVIAGRFYARGILEPEPLLVMDDIYDYKERENPLDGDSWVLWKGYRWWSEGIAITSDSVLNDWIVVLKGRDSLK